MTTTAPEARTAAAPAEGNDVPRLLRPVAAHPYWTVAIVALGARVAFALVSFWVNRYLIPDEQQYVELARTVAAGKPAESWFRFYGQNLYDTTWPYTGGVRLLFEVFGPSRLVAQLWAAAGGTATALLTVVLARRLVSPLFAALAGLIVALMPSQVLWSSVALREGTVWFFLAGLAVVFALSLERRSWGLLPLALGVTVGFWGLYHLRTQTLIAALWALAAAAWFGRSERGKRGFGALVLVAALPVLMGMGIAGLGYVTKNASTISERRTYLSLGADSGVTDTTLLAPPSQGSTSPSQGGTGTSPSGGDGEVSTTTTVPPASHPTAVPGKPHEVVVPGFLGEEYLAEETPQATLHHLPRGLMAFLVRPFPWEHSRNTGIAVARVENVAWYALYVLAIIGAWMSRKRPVIAFPVFLVGGIVMIAGVSQGNVGTAFRHRAQILWVLALLAVVPLERLYLRRRAKPSEVVS